MVKVCVNLIMEKDMKDSGYKVKNMDGANKHFQTEKSMKENSQMMYLRVSELTRNLMIRYIKECYLIINIMDKELNTVLMEIDMRECERM